MYICMQRCCKKERLDSDSFDTPADLICQLLLFTFLISTLLLLLAYNERDSCLLFIHHKHTHTLCHTHTTTLNRHILYVFAFFAYIHIKIYIFTALMDHVPHYFVESTSISAALSHPFLCASSFPLSLTFNALPFKLRCSFAVSATANTLSSQLGMQLKSYALYVVFVVALFAPSLFCLPLIYIFLAVLYYNGKDMSRYATISMYISTLVHTCIYVHMFYICICYSNLCG